MGDDQEEDMGDHKEDITDDQEDDKEEDTGDHKEDGKRGLHQPIHLN